MREVAAIRLDTLLSFQQLATACNLPITIGRQLRDTLRTEAGLGSHPSVPVGELLKQTSYLSTSRTSFRRAITQALEGQPVYMGHRELNYLFGNSKSNVLLLYDLPRLKLPRVTQLRVIRTDIRALLYKLFGDLPGVVEGLMDGSNRLAGYREIAMHYGWQYGQVRKHLVKIGAPFIEVPRPKIKIEGAIFMLSSALSPTK